MYGSYADRLLDLGIRDGRAVGVASTAVATETVLGFSWRYSEVWEGVIECLEEPATGAGRGPRGILLG